MNYDCLQFCANNPHFCKIYCKAQKDMVLWRRKEVNGMKSNKRLFADLAKKMAERELRKDANRTTCGCIYQPKAPAELKRFKNSK